MNRWVVASIIILSPTISRMLMLVEGFQTQLHSRQTSRARYQEPFGVGKPPTIDGNSVPSSSRRSKTGFQATNVWESVAFQLFNIDEDPSQISSFVQCVSALRVAFPALALAASAKIAYAPVSMALAQAIDDSGAFAVISMDASQYIQNVLTTSGLVFALLQGQTYYFMYQQQEAIYLALFEEVTVAKSLLEQVSLVSQGRQTLYSRILGCVDRYVKEDLTRFNDAEPAELISGKPMDDPLQDILYLTSVGEPSIVYETVRSLRQARAYRLGALQRKLPPLHMVLLWSLFGIVLFTFPLLGAGSQTIGGQSILTVQSWYISFIVFAMALTMGVVYELQRPGETGAYNARTVLDTMVTGLEEELEQRMNGEFPIMQLDGPSVDADGGFDDDLLRLREQ